MIHFHLQSLFHILHCLMILTHPVTQDGPLQAQLVCKEPFLVITFCEEPSLMYIVLLFLAELFTYKLEYCVCHILSWHKCIVLEQFSFAMIILSSIHLIYNSQFLLNWERLAFYADFYGVAMLITHSLIRAVQDKYWTHVSSLKWLKNL
jgi:hypothetical protein